MKIKSLCLLTLFCFIGSVFGQDEQFAVLEMDNITEATNDPVTLQVWYLSPSGINRETGDDLDIWITSASGFHSGAAFQEWRPLRRIGSTAAYELAAPDGGWTREHNGEYAVMLSAGEIGFNDGGSFPLTFTGSFRVNIGPNKAIIPPLSGEISVETFPTPGAPGGEHLELAIATLSATFPYPVEINWGDVTVSASGQFSVPVEACEFLGFVPQVITTYTHQVELGSLGVGAYSAALKSGGATLDTMQFQIGNGIPLIKALPSDVQIDIQELPTLGIFPAFSANIRLTFDQYVAETAWGNLQHDGKTLTSELTAWINPAVDLVAPMVIEHQVFLGMLEPGEYLYQLSSLENIIGRKQFVSGTIGGGDHAPPTVEVHGAEISLPGEAPLEFTVEFHDPSELNIAGIEAQSLIAMNWRGETFQIERTRLDVTADFSAGAIATYSMLPPGGTWDIADRGRYRLLLSDPELVSDLAGNHLRNPLIGYLTVSIQPEDPDPRHPAELTLVNNEIIGRWTAAVRLFVPEDLAVRDDWAIEWGAVRAVGPSFFLRPRFVEAGSGNPIGLIPPPDTNGAGMWVEHDYDLGPISHGRWPVCLQSNLGHFSKEVLEAETPDNGIEPFDLWRADAAQADNELWEYLVGTDPSDSRDDHLGDPKPEIIAGEDGKNHLGLRCRIATATLDARLRFQGSSDMNNWIDLGPDQIEEIERNIQEGGIEEFVLCLTDNIEQSDIRYLRVIAERW